MRKEQLKRMKRRSASSSILQEEEEVEEDLHQLHTKDDSRTKREAFRNLKQESETSLDFDDLLPHVGEFGRYQKLLVFLVCLPACIPCGMHAFSQLFMAPVPPHWCRVGGAELRRAAAILVLQQSSTTHQVPVAANAPYLGAGSDWVGEVLGGEGEDTAPQHLGPWQTQTSIKVLTSAFKDIPAGRIVEDEAYTENDIFNNTNLTDMNVDNATDAYKQVDVSTNTKMTLTEPDDSSSNVLDMNPVLMTILTHKARQSHKRAAYTDDGRTVSDFHSTNKFSNGGVSSNTHGNSTDTMDQYSNLSSLDAENNPLTRAFRDKRQDTVGGDAIRISEEDGHPDHQHDDDDRQVANIIASLTTLRQNLERSLIDSYPEAADIIHEQNSSDEKKIIDTETNGGFELKWQPWEGVQEEEDNSDGRMSSSNEVVPSTTTVTFLEHSPTKEYEESYNLPFLTLPSRDEDEENTSETNIIKHSTGASSLREGGSSANREDVGLDDDPILLSLVLGNKRRLEITEPEGSSSVTGFGGSAESLTLAAFEAANEMPAEAGGQNTRGDDAGEDNDTTRLEENGENEMGTGLLVEGTGREEVIKQQEGEGIVEISEEELQFKVEEFLRDVFIPVEGGGYSCCQMYDVNTSSVLAGGDWMEKEDWPTKQCDAGWHFDTSEIYSSIVIDFDLVCSRAIYPTIALAVLNIGGIIGVYVFGTLSDKFGRRLSFLACLGLEQVFALVTAFAPSYQWWLACRFLVGLTIPAIYQIPFIISMELVGPNYRSFVTVLTCLFYVAGMILLSGVAYLVRNWQFLCIVTSLPFFSYIIYWWFLPESPRWLLGQGRLQEASAILQTMARVNGAQLPDTFQQKIKSRMLAQQAASRQSGGSSEATLPPQQQGGFCGLWATPNMRVKTLLIILVWFANETVYVGLSYYGPAMGENEYLSFFLACVVEIPSYLLCWAIMDRCGRRWLLGVSMIVGGICSVATVLMPQDADTLSLCFYLMAKFSESAAFLIIYPFSAELFPTVVRGVGIGFAAYVGGLGLVAIPFINYLGSEMLSLPLVIMGVLSVMGGIAAFRLPETLHQPLPNTLQEGEQFGADFTWSNCWTCLPPETNDNDSNSDLERQISRKYRDEIIDLTTLNEISFDDGETAAGRRLAGKEDSFNSEESDYMTENEYSVDEDYANDSDDSEDDHPSKRRLASTERTRGDLRRMTSSSCEAEEESQQLGALQSQGYASVGRRERKTRMTVFSSERSQTMDTPASEDSSNVLPASGQLAAAHEGSGRRRTRYSASMRSKTPKSVAEEGGSPSTSGGRIGRKLREDTPLQRKASARRGKLVKQSSIVPIITDSSGAMKMTFWM